MTTVFTVQAFEKKYNMYNRAHYYIKTTVSFRKRFSLVHSAEGLNFVFFFLKDTVQQYKRFH